MFKSLSALAALALLTLGTGCGLAPKSQLAAIQSQNKALAEKSKAQVAEIENLKVHSRNIENQLIRAEEELAARDQKNGKQFAAVGSGSRLPSNLAAQLESLSRQFPALQYDPSTGVSKLDIDVLFDSGNAELKPEAQRLLNEFAQLFQTIEARDMKVMVVGHTDALKIARKEARQRHGDNWQLSTDRALAVASALRKAGIRDDRLGIAGFGGNQPVAANSTVEDRRRNRRVEIFVVAPDTPVIGWTESMVTAYGTPDGKRR